MNKLEALQIKLEEARMVEANKRLKREELEELVAHAACPFHINQKIESANGNTATVRSIVYSEKHPFFWINAEGPDGKKILIHDGNYQEWKPAPTTEPPF